MNHNKKKLKKELGQIYDSKKAWQQAGMSIRGRMFEVLKDNPKLDILLKLVLLANVGIWAGLVMNIFRGF